MQTLSDFFFNVRFENSTLLLVRLGILLAVTAILLYGLFRLALVLKTRNNLHRDHQIPLALLLSLALLMPLLSFYFFFLIKLNGLHVFHWSKPDFYLGILPQLLLWLCIVFLFVGASNRFLKNLKNDSPWRNQPS